MILEGIVTTINADDSTNISPMGPIVDPQMSSLRLRPFNTSTTLANLKRHGEGVFHVTDDVELLARAAVGQLETEPPLLEAASVQGRILADACRWYAFQVIELDDRHQRAEILCQVVEQGRLRDFFGLNRAKHAVLEAAILATRTHLIPPEEITAQMNHLAVLVEKTAGDRERRAFAFLQEYIERALSSEPSSDLSHIERQT